MPRIGRVVAPNMPHHVVQRGHNRNAVFVDDGDYSYYLDTLGKWTRQLQVKVYAWCLMTNHVHLLLDPGDDIKSIGLLMKRSGRKTDTFCQQAREPHRVSLGWTLQNEHRRQRRVFPAVLPLYRIKSGKGENGYTAGGLSLVKLPGECRTIAIRNSRSSWVYDHLCDVSFEGYRQYVAEDTPSSEARVHITETREQSSDGRKQVCKRNRIKNWNQVGIQTTRPTAHEQSYRLNKSVPVFALD